MLAEIAGIGLGAQKAYIQKFRACWKKKEERNRISSFGRRRNHVSNMENMGLSATGENSHGFLPIVSLTSVETK